jgi:hypothetical protein
MPVTTYSLQPFSPTSAISIVASVDRQGQYLQIVYELCGDLAAVRLPEAITPVRKFGLWEETCFEFFWGIPGMKPYWEFNLASSGAWNVFRLTDYRSGLTEELAYASMPFQVTQSTDRLTLAVTVDLGVLGVDGPIELSLTAVVQQDDYSYWATRHSGLEADFHLRDSFVVTA